ncbi:MAG: tetratricopeptide repeat protein, partial [Pseudomonadota bacterium]
MASLDDDFLNGGRKHLRAGELQEAEECFRKALADGGATASVKVQALEGLSKVCSKQGRLDEALARSEEAVRAAREMSDPVMKARTLRASADLHVLRGEYEKALDVVEAAYEVPDNGPTDRAKALHRKGRLFTSWGRFDEAFEAYQQSFQVPGPDVGRDFGVVGMMTLGVKFKNLGLYDKALTCYETALPVCDDDSLTKHKSTLLNHIGVVYRNIGQYQRAERYFNESLAIRAGAGIVDGMGDALAFIGLGMVCSELDRLDEALKYFERGLSIQRRIGHDTCVTNHVVGSALLNAGRIDEAEPYILDGGNDSSVGRLYLAKSEWDAAEQLYDRLRRAHETGGTTFFLFGAYTGLGRAYEGRGEYEKAAEFYHKATQHIEDVRSNLDFEDRERFFDVAYEGFSRTEPYKGLARVL